MVTTEDKGAWNAGGARGVKGHDWATELPRTTTRRLKKILHAYRPDVHRRCPFGPTAKAPNQKFLSPYALTIGQIPPLGPLLARAPGYPCHAADLSSSSWPLAAGDGAPPESRSQQRATILDALNGRRRATSSAAALVLLSFFFLLCAMFSVFVATFRLTRSPAAAFAITI